MSLRPVPDDGTIVGAMTSTAGRTVHAGRVNRIDGWSAYSMSPQCVRYRKADGERPAAYERGEYPMLVRRLDHTFAEYADGTAPLHGRKLCRWCVAVIQPAAGAPTTEGGEQHG